MGPPRANRNREEKVKVGGPLQTDRREKAALVHGCGMGEKGKVGVGPFLRERRGVKMIIVSLLNVQNVGAEKE